MKKRHFIYLNFDCYDPVDDSGTNDLWSKIIVYNERLGVGYGNLEYI